MLFYVQMKWNYQGRMSQDKLWDLEAIEGEHGIAGIRSGKVQLFKVVSQHRVIAIVDVDNLEDLDRNSMGWLPMREYLEFEQVWALRDYEGFITDVRAKFPSPGSPPAAAAPATTAAVARGWFGKLAAGKFDAALTFVDPDVVWDNNPQVAEVSDILPWLGSYRGLPQVLKSFEVWAAHSKMLSFQLVGDLMIDGERAMGVVHEHAQCLANGREYDLYVSTCLRVQGGKIVEWRVFWDTAPILAAYRNL